MARESSEYLLLGERDLDIAVMTALAQSTSFRTLFLGAVGAIRFDAPHAFCFARPGGLEAWGQTDVEARWKVFGESLTLLIENKLNAAFQTRQGERYQQRASELRSPTHVVVTVLIAPHSRLTATPATQPFDVRLSVETILEWLAAERTSFESEIIRLSEALRRTEAQERLGIKGHWPELHAALTRELKGRSSGLTIRNLNPTRLLFIRVPGQPDGRHLRYAAERQIVELCIDNPDRSYLDNLRNCAGPEITIRKGGKAFFFRRKDSRVAPSDVVAIADELERVLRWWQSASGAARPETDR